MWIYMYPPRYDGRYLIVTEECSVVYIADYRDGLWYRNGVKLLQTSVLCWQPIPVAPDYPYTMEDKIK